MTDPEATLEAFRARIQSLSERLARQRDRYHSSSYNEETARSEFVSPFFEALGWDIANRLGHALQYRDVVHEEGIKVGDATKAPDYTFRIGGQRKFFVEAKKPGVDLKNDVAPAYQLRRYAWSAKLPLSILTDFEELAVYDTRIRPNETDKASVARVFYFEHTEYAKRAEEIWNIFSKRAVLEGSFDLYAEDNKRKRGTSEVDAEFLKEIEGWREELAKNLALRNTLTVEELNYAVQATIDRILFLRIAEGRGAELYGRLLGLTNSGQIYDRLADLYRQADERYNSGLFDFKADKLSLKLDLDDKVLKPILKDLYYPESPYEFSVLPAEILGNVYEQFLGKVIRLTAGGRAKVEEKPEVKKAGGVYYTPSYIVDYIVAHTVGKLVEGKSPKELAKLRVLDPACGSGSFLLVAYQRLLDAHLAWYREHEPQKHKEAVFEGPGNDWRLTTAEKRRILLNSIYGVDIDRQAVEVTKLSLLLKCLEGETNETLRQMNLYGERALPSLEKNIQCGNSLISPQALLQHTGGLFPDQDELRRINPFDWQKAFPAVFKAGGFDAVIGNPPYGALFTVVEKATLFSTYPAIKGQPESYEYFLFASLHLARAGGKLGMIVPTNFTESDRAQGLRAEYLTQANLHTISSFRYPVWRKNASETLVLIATHGTPGSSTKVVHPHTPEEFRLDFGSRTVDSTQWLRRPGARFLLRAESSLISKIEAAAVNLGEVCEVSQGIIVYKTREEGQRNAFVASSRLGSSWSPLLDTQSSLGRFEIKWGGSFIKYGDWLWCPREERFFTEEKILFVRLRNKSLARKLVAALDTKGFYNRDNFNNIILKDPAYPLRFVLALFNSKLLNYWYKANFDNVNINPAQVRLLPLKRLRTARDRKSAEKLASLTSTMETQLQRLAKTKTSHERVLLERQIEATDAEIDRLVYELYELTPEEIAIVEKE